MLSSETSQARCSKAPQSQEPIRFTVHFLNIFGTTNLTRRIPSPPLSLLCGGINLAARSVAHCVKKKLFGFFDYQGTRRRTGGALITTVPTAAERTGDLSALLGDYICANGTTSPGPCGNPVNVT